MNRSSLEESSERLRLALPLMSRNKVSATPENYWVWYKYVSGSIRALNEHIDDLLERGETVGNDETAALFRRFISAPDQSHLENAEDALRRLLESFAASLRDADAEVTRYGASLEECAAELNPNLDPNELRRLIDAMASSTERMHEGSVALHSHIDDSRQEIAALKDELRRMKEQVRTDALTKLTNRIGLDEAVLALCREFSSPTVEHGLLVIDVDNFKRINDNYGHLFGDKILKVVAEALRRQTKGRDVAARFGGEEFVVLLPETDLAGAGTVAESIRKSIECGRIFNPKTKEEIERVTVSIGVTTFTVAESIDAAIERADEAMYRAKRDGRNRIEENPLPLAHAASA